MEKIRHILNRVLFLLFVLLFGGNAFSQITLSLRYSGTDSKYHVYLTPTTPLLGVTNPKLTDGSSQITLTAPTGNLTIGTVTSVSPVGIWDISTTTRNNGDVASGAPAAKDFFVITPSGDFTTINYTSGVEVELFNFDVTGTCVGSLDILPSAGQTAAGGTLNIGSYYSVKGYAGGIGTNHFASTYGISASCPVPVTLSPDLITSIGQPTTPLTVGVASTIPVTITNAGTAPSTGPIATTFTLPTGTSAPASFTSGTSTCSTSGQTVSCSTPGPLSNVSPTNTAVINVPVTPSASTVGTSPVFAATTSSPDEPVANTGNNVANPMTPTTAVAGVPDLTTSIGQPTTPLVVGQASNVPVTVTNIGTGPANGPIATTFTLPTGTSAPASFTSGASTCTTTGQTVSCSTPGPIAPNGTSVINVPVTPSASTVGTSPTFAATTSAPNEPVANTGNNTAPTMTPTTAVAGVPDLTTSIGQPTTPLVVGQSSNIPVTITNIGSGPATGPIATTITIPTGTTAPASFTSGTSTCSTSGQTVTCSTPGPIAASGTSVINVPVTPLASSAGTTPTFAATTSAPNEPVANTGNNAAPTMTPTTPVAGVPDLTTSIGQPTTPLVVGSASNIPVTVTNIGSAPATGPIATTFTLPTGTTAPASFTSGTSTCSTSGQTVTCSTPGPIAASGTSVINVPVTPLASSAGTTPTFAATTSAPNEPVANTANNVAPTMTPTTPVAGVPDLTTSIGQPTTPLAVGVVSNIPVTVTNIGTGPATGPIATTFTLPTGTTAPASFTSGTSTCSTSGQTVTCSTPGPIAASGTSVINVPVTPLASSAGTTPTFAATTSAPNEPVANTGNNVAPTMTPTTPVAGVPDLTTSIGQPTTPLVVGSASNIPVTVTNIGSAPATGPIATTFTLPTGTTAPASFTSGTSTCSTSGQTVTCSTPGPIAPSGTSVINVPVTPLASSAGTTPTFAATTSAPNEPVANTGNNAAPTMTPTTPVAGVPDLTTSIGQPTTPLAVGVVSNIPVTVTNIGSAPATGPITTTFTLPTGTTAPASFTSGTSTCSTSGQTVTCSTPSSLSNVSPNNTTVINVPVTPLASSAGTTPIFTATTSAPNEPVANTANNAAPTMTPTTPVAGVPDLITSIGQPATPLAVGVVSNIPVTVTNVGSGPATGPITTTFTLPTGTTAPASFTSGTSTCSTSGQTVTCSTPGSLSNVSPNNTSVINVPVTPLVSSAGTTPVFAATSSAPNEPVANTANNAAPTMTPTTPVAGIPDLTTSIGQPTTPLVVGSVSNIPVTVTNIGTGPATGPITTTFTLPTGTTAPASFTSGTSTCSTSGQTVTCSTPSSLAPSGTVVINVPVTPLASSVGTTPTFTATTSAPNEPVANTANNAAPTMTPTTPVAGVPDLITSIGQPATPLVVGQASNVPVTVTNIGTGPATGPIATTFNLPNGTSAPASFTSGTSVCSTSGLVVSCSTPGPIAPNGAVVISVPVTPLASTVGTTPTFTATSSAPNEPVANTGNNAAPTMTPTAPVQAAAAPDLVLSFGTPSPALTVGISSTIPVTVGNIGGATAMGQLVFTFNIPNNTTSPLSYNAGNGWVCSASGSLLTCVNANTSGLAVSAISMLNIQLTPNANTAGQSVILNGSVVAVPNETATTNNTSVVLVPTPIAPGVSLVTLTLKAMLQGALLNSTGGLMRDDLRTKGLIPSTQPYSAANGFTQVNGGGAETVSSTALAVTGNNAIVDWVFVELRNGTTSSTVVATRSALIQRDGDIVDVDGVSPITFTNAAVVSGTQYYVSVRHRNHLGVMTASPITINAATAVDFTSISLANYQYPSGDLRRSTAPQATQGGIRVMWAGNSSGDNKVIFQGPNNDPDAVFFDVLGDVNNTNSIVNFIRNNVYSRSDIDMNGKVIFQGPNNEVDSIFFETFGHPDNTSQIINFIIWQQLP